MTSPYLARPLRTESQARAELMFALGVQYARLLAVGKSTDGILRRAVKIADVTPSKE